ncbi:MAG TPA: efflux RND transporter periplasmic adaptor subunit [Candidatus Limnocylindrales bacterium]|nr:efflux RND transporter periplasmic adaptor subunit [Candidatus Limnocylindrales bacterium]
MPRTAIHALTLAAIALLATGCGNKVDAGKPAGPQAFPVKVITASAQLVPQSTDYLATLKSRNAAVLQPQVEGDITRIFVHSGERVQAGAPILEIDPRKQEATVSNQEATYKSKLANLELARVDLDRKQKLYAAGVIAKAELDASQTAYDAAKADAAALEAAIREQKVQLRYYTVNAPSNGIIGDIPVKIGDHVTSQTQLTTLDHGGQLEAYIYVPAEKSAQVRMGMPVDLLDDNGKPAARTKVFFISPRVDTDSQTLLVKTQVPNPEMKFRNAQQVHARVIWSEKNSPVIPVTAVSRLSGKIFAFVAEPQGQQTVARQRSIEVGDLVGNDYVVLGGIQPGDKIIVSNIQMLVDGMPVVPQS